MDSFRIQQYGFSLVEVVIVSALSLLIFVGLFASFQYTFDLIGSSKAQLSALSIANDRMEYFRSLPYDEVGTVSGIPSGTIPQNSVRTLNGVNFYERVLVEYVDDAADGEGVLDSNAVVADYKRVKVEYSWSARGATSTIALIGNIVPRSIETSAGGGTVRVNVIDENAQLLPGASVRLFNDSTSPVIDVTRSTDSSGAALFSGAPVASDYEVEVTATISGADYSTAQTYQSSIANPSPTVAPFAVLDADVSTLTFQIGTLSDLTITALSSATEGSSTEAFTDLTSVDSFSQVQAQTGKLKLADNSGSYFSEGWAYLGVLQPATLEEWKTVTVAATVLPNTSFTAHIYTGASTSAYTLVPDADLPGNATGFSAAIIDISTLDVAAYPALTIGVHLVTSNTTFTPEIDEVGVFYRASHAVFPSFGFDVLGAKIIGYDASVQPIYKYSSTVSTDVSGQATLSDLEFDTYTFDPQTAYDIASACPSHPVLQRAGVDGDTEFILVPNRDTTARVIVVDDLGRAIPGVSVQVTGSGYDVTQSTNTCGQTFFTGGLTGGDYTVTATAVGYTSQVLDLSLAEDSVVSMTMN